MKFFVNLMKGLLSIIVCTVVSYLFWLLFRWLSPIVVNLSWWWLLAYTVVITSIITSLFIQAASLVSVIFNKLIAYKVFTFINLPIIAFFAVCSVLLPWRAIDGMTFRAFLWGLILSINIVELYGTLIAGLFYKD